ncbi:MAG: hypothetical protein LBB21_04365 [Holosporaceae bacterium]|jgi:hypothetical protein|nr:hypothetical protein [Holosporaceae bacterium]
MSKDFFDLDRLREDSLLLKSAVLCCGLKQNAYSKELLDAFNPSSVKRTGNVGIHFRIDSLIVNAGFSQPSIEDELSPIELKKVGKNCWGIYINDVFVKVVSLIDVPKWYSKRTSLSVSMGEIFLFEGENNDGFIGGYMLFFSKRRTMQILRIFWQ